jgi:hypothetical protein
MLRRLHSTDSVAQIERAGRRSAGRMQAMVSLAKIVDGKPAVADILPNQQRVKCPRCAQRYRLAYSDDEWHRLSAWLGKAERAMRQSHKTKHAADVLELSW